MNLDFVDEAGTESLLCDGGAAGDIDHPASGRLHSALHGSPDPFGDECERRANESVLRRRLVRYNEDRDVAGSATAVPTRLTARTCD